MGPVWAAVPVKGFAGAKQRLAGVLAPDARAALAEAMLADVLAVLAAAPLAGILVNTEDEAAATLARGFGAETIAMDALAGHTASVVAMGRHLAALGRGAMLTVPGDIPCVTADEIAALVASAQPAPSFTIAPSRDSMGSNAVLLAPPGAVALRFGEDSYVPHLAAARAAGIAPRIVAQPGIGLDIDTPGDLHALRASTLPIGPRTRVILATLPG
ncbi:MAG: 2-phospho-L-lactate guanylyltransferase [Rhodospirillales bacterium]|nr:2-phospho-L-lactate guanylyltransferase [Rhodospirillales bacterium]